MDGYKFRGRVGKPRLSIKNMKSGINSNLGSKMVTRAHSPNNRSRKQSLIRKDD